MLIKEKMLLSVSVTGLVLALPSHSVAGRNLDEYSLRVRVVQTRWTHYTNARTASPRFHSPYEGEGRGNIEDGPAVNGFDFSYACSCPVERTIVGTSYPAKWKKAQTQLAVLVPKMGEADKYEECELKASALPGVYVSGPGGVRQISQDEFQARRHGGRATPTPQAVHTSAPPDATAGSRQGPNAKVSVSSSPDGADIEVDGDFMGNTPSSVELPLGEHTITVRKSGCKPWERKLKLTGGDVRLNAELERDVQK